MQSADEILGSASLLMTIVTVLFGLWYTEIRDAVKFEIPAHLEDAQTRRKTIDAALRWRAIPLFVSSSFVCLAFLPIAVSELVQAWENLTVRGWQAAVGAYDAAAVALIGVVVFAASLAVMMGLRIGELGALRKRLANG